MIKKTISVKPDVSLEEMRVILEKNCKIYVTIQAIHYFLQRLKISYKKKSLYSCQRETDEVKKKDPNLLK